MALEIHLQMMNGEYSQLISMTMRIVVVSTGPVAVRCRSFDSIYCNKGEELRD